MRQFLLGTFIAAAFSIACPALSERNPSAAEIDELRAQGMTEVLLRFRFQHAHTQVARSWVGKRLTAY
jgi:hypothetical protein